MNWIDEANSCYDCHYIEEKSIVIMRLIHAALVLLITISILLFLIMMAEQPSFPAAGMAHEKINAMMTGGDGLSRFIHIGSLSYWLQNCVLVLVLVLISLSIKQTRRTTLYWLVMSVVGLLMFTAWHMIYRSYYAFLQSGVTEYALGFPISTAWMLYTVWSSSALLCLFYVLGYRRFIYTEADEAEFAELLKTGKTSDVQTQQHQEQQQEQDKDQGQEVQTNQKQDSREEGVQ